VLADGERYTSASREMHMQLAKALSTNSMIHGHSSSANGTSAKPCKPGPQPHNRLAGSAEEQLQRVHGSPPSRSSPPASPGAPSARCTEPTPALSSETQAAIAEAIEANLPSNEAISRKAAQRALFTLARALKGIFGLAGVPPKVLSEIAVRWYARAKNCPALAGYAIDDVRLDLIEGFRKVKYAAGAGPIEECFARAKRQPVPAVALEYEQPEVRLLVALCIELQRNAGDGEPWPLACRIAGPLLGVSHETAARWLRLLIFDGVLELMSEGKHIGTDASMYRLWTQKENCKS